MACYTILMQASFADNHELITDNFIVSNSISLSPLKYDTIISNKGGRL